MELFSIIKVKKGLQETHVSSRDDSDMACGWLFDILPAGGHWVNQTVTFKEDKLHKFCSSSSSIVIPFVPKPLSISRGDFFVQAGKVMMQIQDDICTV